MSDFTLAGRGVVYRFDEADENARHKSDLTVLFAVGLESKEGAFLADLQGPYSPFGVQTADVLKRRLGLENGVWTEVYTFEGSASSLVAGTEYLEKCFLEQHGYSKEVDTTMVAAMQFLREKSGNKRGLSYDIPQLWCLKRADIELLMSILPDKMNDSRVDDWREIVTRVVRAKAEAAFEKGAIDFQ